MKGAARVLVSGVRSMVHPCIEKTSVEDSLGGHDLQWSSPDPRLYLSASDDTFGNCSWETPMKDRRRLRMESQVHYQEILSYHAVPELMHIREL